jgi:hypothetical protein
MPVFANPSAIEGGRGLLHENQRKNLGNLALQLVPALLSGSKRELTRIGTLAEEDLPMRRTIATITIVLCAAMTVTAQDDSEADTTAIDQAAEAAEMWLAIVDSAGWSKSYAEAAQFFKSQVPVEVWIRQVRGVRTELGRVLSRKLTGSEYATSLPGAPDGEYVVLTYSTVFENKAQATETITPMKDPDGVWRVSGYYVK